MAAWLLFMIIFALAGKFEATTTGYTPIRRTTFYQEPNTLTAWVMLDSVLTPGTFITYFRVYNHRENPSPRTGYFLLWEKVQGQSFQYRLLYKQPITFNKTEGVQSFRIYYPRLVNINNYFGWSYDQSDGPISMDTTTNPANGVHMVYINGANLLKGVAYGTIYRPYIFSAEVESESTWLNTGIQGNTGDPGPTGMKGPPGDVGDVGGTGPNGLQGDQGPPGSKGETGEQGPKGLKGEIGANGDKGPTGPTGLKGPKGEKGITGIKGPKGSKGLVGITGPQGVQGPKGSKGLKGEPGVVGDKGVIGRNGTKGDKGPTGATGDPGQKGDKGETGSQGPRLKGPPGPVGPIGDPGPAGPAGDPGEKGPKGPQGDKGGVGPTGPPGPKGPAGSQGPIGIRGLKGPTGDQGDKGPVGDPSYTPGGPGPQGPSGPSGPSGDTGSKGDKGDEGDKGEVGPTVQGPPGDTGDEGDQGDKGLKGDLGPQGLKGIYGPEGPQGSIGDEGDRGPRGELGPKGPKGVQGNTGPVGDEGDKGSSGPTGPPGVKGPKGIPGYTATLSTMPPDKCATSGCDQNCFDTFNSFYCTCNPGYQLQNDGTTCTDVNECLVYQPCDQLCNNTVGSFQCSCYSGYTLERNRCRKWELVFKATSGGVFGVTNLYNTPGDFNTANATVRGLDDTVVDHLKSSILDTWENQHITKVKVGLYTDTVEKFYFIFDGTGTDKYSWCSLSRMLEMSNNSLVYGNLTLATGIPQQQQDKMFEIQPQSVTGRSSCNWPPLYVVVADAALTGHTCPALATTSTVKIGFFYPGSVQIDCVAIFVERDNPCAVANGGCAHKCHNMVGNLGNHFCSCSDGYTLDPDGRGCSDVNECTTYRPCEQLCDNTVPGFTCRCRTGYQQNTTYTNLCDDINECALVNAACGQYKQCINTAGSFVCFDSEFVPGVTGDPQGDEQVEENRALELTVGGEDGDKEEIVLRYAVKEARILFYCVIGAFVLCLLCACALLRYASRDPYLPYGLITSPKRKSWRTRLLAFIKLR